MNRITLKQKIMVVVALIGAALIFIFPRGIDNKPPQSTEQPRIQEQTQVNQNEEPGVVSTNPENLDGTTILANQTIEITFNLPLENRGEFKNRIDPEAEYEIKLSDDRKTAKIIPLKPYKLGTGFTLFIKPDTKFDGKKQLEREIIYHFRTINYKGV